MALGDQKLSAAESPACGSTQESLINSLAELFNHSLNRYRLEGSYLPDSMLSAEETLPGGCDHPALWRFQSRERENKPFQYRAIAL